MSGVGIQGFYPISDTEWEWVCDLHGRHCGSCPKETIIPISDHARVYEAVMCEMKIDNRGGNELGAGH